MLCDIKGKVVLVTGASRGLGRYLCNFFGEMGLKVVAIARNNNNLESLKKDIQTGKSENVIKCFALDVRDYSGLKKAVDEVTNDWGTIDILINNAAWASEKDFLEQTKEDIDNTIDINLKGTIYLTHIVAPIMIKNNKGHIINISSTSGLRGLKFLAIYAASKHGVNGFSDSMSRYLIEHNVLVTTLCPGGINTSWWGDRWKYYFDKKMLMKPEVVAELIKFILSTPTTTMFKIISFFPICEIEFN